MSFWQCEKCGGTPGVTWCCTDKSMTANTETEQLHQLLELVLTELDRKSIPFAYMQEIDRKGKAFIEQAARRAPVVPQGWKLVPVEPTTELLLPLLNEGELTAIKNRPEPSEELIPILLRLTGVRERYNAMLAAAPQPPEACTCPSGDGSLRWPCPQHPPEAAPVQLPENIREGEPYDNPAFEALARALGVWCTAQSAVCAQFWIAAKEQST